jgi:molybdopterin/thiamine biosynthesis adenylyltransferase/rhodanese-related sulfurtransferase
MNLTPDELARYSRHLSLSELGLAGQEKLKAARVLVVGAGGLGSPALLYLAAAGIGTIGIVDFDCIDISNLQRQVLFDTQRVAQPKAEVARERLLALNPHLNVVVFAIELRASNVMDILRGYDLVLDGTDRFATRYLVNDACVLLHKPLVSAAIHRFEGQAFTYVPQRGPCYRCLFPQPPADGAVPNCAEAGVLGVLPGVMGTIQATEAIKLITGIGEPLLGRLLTYDALDMRFNEFSFAARTDCAVCGTQPSIKSPQDQLVACAIDEPLAISVSAISVSELRTLMNTAHTHLQLVDVREPYEYAAGHIEGSSNIPLQQLLQSSASFDKELQLIFVCRSGGRSAQACRWAQAKGRTDALNVAGGMLAWRQMVDPRMVVV